MRLLMSVLILLTISIWQVPVQTRAQPPADIEVPQDGVRVSGLMRDKAFEQLFSIKAVGGDIGSLVFTATTLSDVVSGHAWISSSNIQITPAKQDVKMGDDYPFLVRVQGVPQPGQYEGNVFVGYAGQPAGRRYMFRLVVAVADFQPVPAAIVVDFERNVFGFGASQAVSWPVILDGTDNNAPLLISELTRDTEARLSPLVDSSNEIHVIPRDALLVANKTLKATTDGRSVETNLEFRNLDVDPGEYTGTLSVVSRNLGTVAQVPVKVRVRYPGWLALLLLIMGILLSVMLTWWKTIGKKKNRLRVLLSELRYRLEQAKVTRISAQRLNDQITYAWGQLNSDDWAKVEGIITSVTDDLKVSAANKLELVKKSEQLGSDLVQVERLSELVKQTFNLPDMHARIFSGYVSGIRTDLTKLKQGIDWEEYQSITDERLKASEVSLKYRVDLITNPRPGGLVDSWNYVNRKIMSLPLEYRAYWLTTWLRSTKDQVAQIETVQDMQEVLHNLSEEVGKLNRVGLLAERLKGLKEHLDQSGNGDSLAQARRIYKKAIHSLKIGDVATAEKNAEEARKALNAAPFTDDTREAKVEDVVDAVAAGGHITMFKEAAVTGAPSAGEITWQPQWTNKVVAGLLFLAMVVVLTTLGFNQLYANNPTFGARNGLEECVALFLWGFGIQAGSATVSGVVQTFQG